MNECLYPSGYNTASQLWFGAASWTAHYLTVVCDLCQSMCDVAWRRVIRFPARDELNMVTQVHLAIMQRRASLVVGPPCGMTSHLSWFKRQSPLSSLLKVRDIGFQNE